MSGMCVVIDMNVSVEWRVLVVVRYVSRMT